MSQSNTKEGDLMIVANEDLSVLSDVLVAPYNASGQLVVTRPAANNDNAVYVLIYGAAAGSPATVRPLSPTRSVRVTAKGSGNPAALLVLADGVTTAAEQGQGAFGREPDGGIRHLSGGGHRRGGVCRRPDGEDAPDVRNRGGLSA